MELFKERHYVKLAAGLGNQFYMLAYADYLQNQRFKIKWGGVRMLLDKHFRNKLGDSKSRKTRNLQLDIPQKLGIKLASKFESKILYRLECGRLPFRKQYSWYKPLFVVHREPVNQWAVFFPFNKENDKVYNVHIGYYQSYQYISDSFRERLSKVVGELCEGKKKYDIQPNDVALHIRRGDFLKFAEIYHKIEINYYLKALAELSSEKDIGKVYIFSDDFEAIKEEIELISQKYKVILVEGQSVLEDMNTFRYFSNYILGNSTFAWWGAMLSLDKNPKVFVPKTPWKIPMPDASPYFTKWIQIENV